MEKERDARGAWGGVERREREAGVEIKKEVLPSEACPDCVQHTSAAASSQLSPGCEKLGQTVTQTQGNQSSPHLPTFLTVSLQAGAVLRAW